MVRSQPTKDIYIQSFAEAPPHTDFLKKSYQEHLQRLLGGGGFSFNILSERADPELREIVDAHPDRQST